MLQLQDIARTCRAMRFLHVGGDQIRQTQDRMQSCWRQACDQASAQLMQGTITDDLA